MQIEPHNVNSYVCLLFLNTAFEGGEQAVITVRAEFRCVAGPECSDPLCEHHWCARGDIDAHVLEWLQ